MIGSSAYAADIEPPAPYDWSGLYLGLHAGYLWGDVSIEEEEAAPGGDIEGFVGGALAGFNVQFDSLVLGVEGDIGWSDADGEGGQILVIDYSYDLNWNAHIRAKAGFAFDNTLIFVAGGYAHADLDIDQEVSGGIGGGYDGWSIGGGIDHAFSDDWIGRIEYLHDDFGDKDYEEDLEDYTADLNTDTVRAALIFKFMP